MDNKDQDSFVQDLQSANFQIAMEIFKKEQIKIAGKTEFQDLFLME